MTAIPRSKHLHMPKTLIAEYRKNCNALIRAKPDTPEDELAYQLKAEQKAIRNIDFAITEASQEGFLQS